MPPPPTPPPHSPFVCLTYSGCAWHTTGTPPLLAAFTLLAAQDICNLSDAPSMSLISLKQPPSMLEERVGCLLCCSLAQLCTGRNQSNTGRQVSKGGWKALLFSATKRKEPSGGGTHTGMGGTGTEKQRGAPRQWLYALHTPSVPNSKAGPVNEPVKGWRSEALLKITKLLLVAFCGVKLVL